MWGFSMTNYRVSARQWFEVAQKGEVPPPLDQFASTTYLDSNKKLKFVVAKGAGIFGLVDDVYR
jgi:hypothetical protein